MSNTTSDAKFQRVITYFSTAVSADAFDLAIKQVPNDEDGDHANVELVFLQDKGSQGRTDVVAAIRMQAFQLKELHQMIGKKLQAAQDGPDSLKD